MTLEIIDPGMACTVQDSGRRHFRKHGLATGGAADLQAYNWANKLLDNPARAACLEIVMGGFRAVARQETTLGLAGCDAPVRVNGQPVDSWSTVQLARDDEIAIGMSRGGRLIYLAVPGGLDTAILFRSRSMVVREKLPGHLGISAGDCLGSLGPVVAHPHRRIPPRHRPDYTDNEICLRLLPAYQYRQFSRHDLLRLSQSTYEVSQQSDRMGYRLSGPARWETPGQILSEGMAVGAVQIPGDGQPIVLMPDCQTVGGYPKPGTLARADLGKLSQRQPGQTVRFVFASLEEIQCERMLSECFFRRTLWTESGGELVWI